MRFSRVKKIKTLIIISIVVVLGLTIPALLILENIARSTTATLGENAKNIALVVASLVEQDMDNYRNLIQVDSYTPGSYDEAYYHAMLKLFQKLKNDTGATYIYTEKIIDNDEFIYILDGEYPGSQYFSPIGSIDSMSALELGVLLGGPAVASQVVRSSIWGNTLSGYAPIVDPTTGKTVGLAGVDFSLDYIKEINDQIGTVVILCFIVLAGGLSGIAFFIVSQRSKTLATDFMTGLANRQYHENQLPLYIHEARANHRPLSLMMMDIDSFKQINDQYGHVFGDEALRQIADIIKNNIRVMDVCSRYGGDEFIMILPDSTGRDAVAIANRLVRKIREVGMKIGDIGPAEVTISIGVVQWSENMDVRKLTECADFALYQSKKAGKNRVSLYQAPPVQ